MENSMHLLAKSPTDFDSEKAWHDYVVQELKPMIERVRPQADTKKEGQGRYIYLASDGRTEFEISKADDWWVISVLENSTIGSWGRKALKAAKISAELALWNVYRVRAKFGQTTHETERWLGEGQQWF